jgi:hypothetical protein
LKSAGAQVLSNFGTAVFEAESSSLRQIFE